MAYRMAVQDYKTELSSLLRKKKYKMKQQDCPQADIDTATLAHSQFKANRSSFLDDKAEEYRRAGIGAGLPVGGYQQASLTPEQVNKLMKLREISGKTNVAAINAIEKINERDATESKAVANAIVTGKYPNATTSRPQAATTNTTSRRNQIRRGRPKKVTQEINFFAKTNFPVVMAMSVTAVHNTSNLMKIGGGTNDVWKFNLNAHLQDIQQKVSASSDHRILLIGRRDEGKLLSGIVVQVYHYCDHIFWPLTGFFLFVSSLCDYSWQQSAKQEMN